MDKKDNEEIIFEEGEKSHFNQDPAKIIKKLRDRLKACQAEKQEHLETSQRLKADYINLKKHEERAREDFAKYAKIELLEELLELADAFEMAFQNRMAWEKVDENWRRGVEYIYNKLRDIFRHNGLEEVNPVKETFNPEEHHSVGFVETANPENDHKVLEIIQKGYKLNGRIVRPAKVRVGHIINN